MNEKNMLSLQTEIKSHYNMNISRVIKDYGYTLADVAEKIGVARGTLANTVTNNPTYKTMRAIAQAVGCQVSDFFADETEKNEPEIRALVTRGQESWHAESLEELETIVKKLKA